MVLKKSDIIPNIILVGCLLGLIWVFKDTKLASILKNKLNELKEIL